jgi:glycerol-3-phosphate dehydrogenase (NAD(P)+)
MPVDSPGISVLGAGSWGTALAIHAARLHPNVVLWGRDPGHMAVLERSRENTRYLPGVPLPANLRITADREEAVGGRDLILVVVPTSGFRETERWVAPLLQSWQRVAWATKGLEMSTGAWLHEVSEEELPGQPAAVLSGPSFAGEVAREQPTALTIATGDSGLAELVARAFHGRAMRLYRNSDVLGVELGGAFKNVLAIAAGISDGAGFGANARAALMTRGLAELRRLGTAVGARPETLTGLSGLGDLVLTCTDDQSRNRRLGLYLGQGFDLDTAKARIGQAVEGAETARVAVAKATEAGVEMPICAEVHAVLYQGRPVREAVRRLLERDPVAEDGQAFGRG